jgi:hypothetical protein
MAAAKVQVDQAVAVRPVAAPQAAVDTPPAVPTVVIRPPVQSAVIPQLPRRAFIPLTRHKMGQTLILLRRAGSGFLYNLVEAPATTCKTRRPPPTIDASINGYFSDLYGIELGQIDPGLVWKIDRARPSVPVEERLHLVHHRFVTRLPNIWDV